MKQLTHPKPHIALLACAVFEKEIELLCQSVDAPHLVEVRFFEMGLHDQPPVLRSTLQKQINELDALENIDAIVLAYGLCGCGTAGLHSKKHKIIRFLRVDSNEQRHNLRSNPHRS